MTSIEELAAGQQSQANMLASLAQELAVLRQEQQQQVLMARLQPSIPMRLGSLAGGSDVAPAGTSQPGQTNMLADGTITAEAIAAGAISAQHIQVGMDRANLLLNGSFEESTGTTGVMTYPTKLAAWASNASNGLSGFNNASAGVKHGKNIGVLEAAATPGDYTGLFQIVPVQPGRKYRLSGWAWCGGNTGGAAATILAHALDKDGGYVTYNALVAINNTTGTSTWGEAYWTCPASGVSSLIVYCRWSKGATTADVGDQFGFDDVRLEQVPDVVQNSTADVVIDSAGITVTDGAITVQNAGSTVIIDGTSNMFKIAATGTLSRAWGGSGTSYSVNATLTAVGTMSTPALTLWNVTEDNAVDSGARSPADLWAPDGSYTMSRRVMVYGLLAGTAPNYLKVEMYIENRNSGTLGWTAAARYYVLKEVAI